MHSLPCHTDQNHWPERTSPAGYGKNNATLMQVLIKNLLGQTIRNTGGNHGGYVRPMAVCEYLYVYHNENRILGTFQELTTNTDHLLFNQD